MREHHLKDLRNRIVSAKRAEREEGASKARQAGLVHGATSAFEKGEVACETEYKEPIEIANLANWKQEDSTC